MATSQEIEQRFWSKVWRCSHRHPCKKCCWPWRTADLSVNWQCAWEYHPTFVCKALGLPSPISAARFAYETRHGTIALGTKHFHMCHRCHFGPCCNPEHLALGSHSDNMRDKDVARSSPRIIFLPDRRQWSYKAAHAAQGAFYEAWSYQRVFAGEIHPQFVSLAFQLDRPWHLDWPGEE